MNLRIKFLPRTLLMLGFIAISQQLFAQQGILWQIDNGRSRPSYLMGTVHSDDPRVMNLPNPIQRKFDQADSFSAELKMDVMSLLQSQGMMLYTDGRKLVDVIGQRLYRKVVPLMQQRGMPEMMVQQMKPWAVAAQLNLPKSQSGVFLDMKLFQEASVSGKPVYGLETMAEQMGVFEGMSEREQIVFLEESIKHADEVPEMIRTILDLYLAGDLTGLKQYSDRVMARNSSRLSEIFQKRLIVDRNQRMVDRMQVRIDEGNAFIAVGALHLPGENGILRLLEQQGYRVTSYH